MKCTDNTGQRSAYTEREWARIQAKERREIQRQRHLILAAVILLLIAAVMTFMVYYFVLRSHDYTLTQQYNKTDAVLGVGSTLTSGNVAEPFAGDLCVANGEVNISSLAMEAYSAGLFDLNNTETVYAKDIFTKRSPASITKIMTALVTMKYGNLDDIVTVTPTVKDIEYGSSVCDIKEGDVLSLRQLLYGMIIASGNDAAMMIAEHIGGSVDNFVSMMNEEAARIGATNTHFTNPHGLTDSEHYTTVYDIYLMMNEALKYDVFQDIISRKNYYAEYSRVDGSPVAVTWESTNHYFTNEADAPEDVVVYGGKTGTTDDAGACLALLAKDLYGNPYLSIILHAGSKDSLYVEMNQLLSLIES
ncbi:MAG: serine hydrolase [Lachnospiraceae bacterium]|nr:serine hydrolase [Lachnospiraceae bacterium]